MRVRAFRDGAQSTSTRSYSASTCASASSSFQMSRTDGCGPSKLIAAGEPTITSTTPPRPRVQPEGVIAARTVFSFGLASTSATLTAATGTSMPVDTSACGSRSTTRVETPRANAAEARPSVTVVFPTPPFKEETLSTCTISRVAAKPPRAGEPPRP